MATTTARPRRTSEEWDAIAQEILPRLQAGEKLSEVRESIGVTNTWYLKIALGNLGYDVHGQPLKVKPVSAARPATRAKQVAQRRKRGEPWWQLEVATGKTSAQLQKEMREHGYEDVSTSTTGS